MNVLPNDYAAHPGSVNFYTTMRVSNWLSILWHDWAFIVEGTSVGNESALYSLAKYVLFALAMTLQCIEELVAGRLSQLFGI
jgi:hypothetical protein